MQTRLLLTLLATATALTIPASNVIRAPLPQATTFTYEPILKGFVSFGDSYAAGVGAGITSSDGCRVGTNSYPNLLNTWVGSFQPNIDFQNYPCSGAVAAEIVQGSSKSQIDKRSDPINADRATFSVGGNDVGFFPILNACVLRIFNIASGDCQKTIQRAYDLMSSDDFKTNVGNALRQAIDKSGRDDFQIIHTSYPTFFNPDTDSCDTTTFYFHNPGHHGFQRPQWDYLTKPLRVQLNTLVSDLNKALSKIVDDLNSGYASRSPKVIFADINSAFGGHRFCEEGITEPDPNNEGNWFFMTSWPDVDVSGAGILADSDGPDDLATQVIPNDSTCAATQDWAEQILCGMGEAGLAWNGPNGLQLNSTMELPDGTEISTDEVNWFYPTKWVKTFHPRSTGQKAYRDLVKAQW